MNIDTNGSELGQRENGEGKLRRQDLETKSLDQLQDHARKIGIPEWSTLEKKMLVKRISEVTSPSH